VVWLFRQRRLWYHVLSFVRRREGQEEEQEEGQARAAPHEPAQQRGRKKGKRNYTINQGNFKEPNVWSRKRQTPTITRIILQSGPPDSSSSRPFFADPAASIAI
jgi:hypothetical protein